MSAKPGIGTHPLTIEKLVRLCDKKKAESLTIGDLQGLVGKTVFTTHTAWKIGKIQLTSNAIVFWEFYFQNLATIFKGERIELLFDGTPSDTLYQIVLG